MNAKAGYLYRGVHAAHPALEDARRGEVRPANPESTMSPQEHNVGGVFARSPFTSWTHNIDLALWHANQNGVGGVMLRVPIGPPAASETWTWVRSEDGWYEDEVLLRGVRLERK